MAIEPDATRNTRNHFCIFRSPPTMNVSYPQLYPIPKRFPWASHHSHATWFRVKVLAGMCCHWQRYLVSWYTDELHNKVNFEIRIHTTVLMSNIYCNSKYSYGLRQRAVMVTPWSLKVTSTAVHYSRPSRLCLRHPMIPHLLDKKTTCTPCCVAW